MEVITHQVMRPQITKEYLYCCTTMEDMVEHGPVGLESLNKVVLVYHDVAGLRRTKPITHCPWCGKPITYRTVTK